jgi:signal transduction histidine kinase
MLLGQITDLLPQATLKLCVPDPGERFSRSLAALPIRLAPGSVPATGSPWATPVRLALVTAWGCVAMALAAVAALLAGAVLLSERRAAFVSAVTHELRTPLTTFRMYTEMLLEGMVPDEDKRRRYLATLRTEAERLGHLVENVLAYARLERGRPGGRIDDVALGALIERCRERLARRAEQAGMSLVLEADEAGLATVVRADPAAVEQILLNLVDNACKYAASAGDKRIHLEIGGDRRDGPPSDPSDPSDQSDRLQRPRAGDRERGHRFLRVRDHGPGISKSDARRLFRPFSKSARDAANSVPGVGLGLALSQRLARAMGGSLDLDRSVADGACFVLGLRMECGL